MHLCLHYSRETLKCTALCTSFDPSGSIRIPESGQTWARQQIQNRITMKIVNNSFANEEILLDFHEYEQCKFRDCRFVVLGYGPFSLNQCEVVNCAFTFAGPAHNTIQTMSAIYHNNGDQGKQLIESTFENIRKAPAAPAPAN